jgi:hypothetical protein
VILLLGLILALVVALLRGGKLNRLLSVKVRHSWIAPLAWGLQVAVIYFPRPRSEGLLELHTLLVLASYLLLVLVVALNWRLPGLPLIGLGLALNLLVMVANGGFMPVTYEALQRAGMANFALGSAPGSRVMATKDIVLPRADTVLWALSDVFVIPPPWPIRTIFSAGDLSLVVGTFVLFQRVMCHRSRAPQGKVQGDQSRTFSG